MAEEIAQLKQLQAGINAAFHGLFEATEESPNNGKAIAAAKGKIATMAQMTFGAVLGPAFSIISLSTQVSLRVDVDNLESKLTSPQANCICCSANCIGSETL
jgi:hypothetical protein